MLTPQALKGQPIARPPTMGRPMAPEEGGPTMEPEPGAGPVAPAEVGAVDTGFDEE